MKGSQPAMFDDDNNDDTNEQPLADASLQDGSESEGSQAKARQPLRPKPRLKSSAAPSRQLPVLPSLDTREGAALPDDSPDAQPSPAAIERRRYAARPGRHAAIPGLLPRGSVNLLIGSSTAGKTILLLSQLEAYASAGEFLGYRILPGHRPAQLGCLIATGSLESLHDRIHALQLATLADPTVFPASRWKMNPDETLAAALRRHHGSLCEAAGFPVHLLVIEGFQLLLEGSGKVNDPRAVKDFYDVVADFCLDRNVTILATVGQAKLRRNESYPLLADRVYGSTVWAQEAQTLIGIEWTRLDLPEERRPNTRKIIIQPRGLEGPLDEKEDVEASSEATNATLAPSSMTAGPLSAPAGPQRKVVYAEFDEQGRLLIIPTGVLADTESATFHRLDDLLEAEPDGQVLTKEDLIAWGETLSVKLRTVERWLASRCDPSLAMLERLGSNRLRTYRKPLVQ